jgi:hypothetical protein
VPIRPGYSGKASSPTGRCRITVDELRWRPGTSADDELLDLLGPDGARAFVSLDGMFENPS